MLKRHVEGEPEEYRLLRESLLKLIDLEHNKRRNDMKKDKIVEHMRCALRQEEALSMEEALSLDGYHYVGKLRKSGNKVWEGDDDYLILKPNGEWKRIPYIPMGTTYDDLEDA